MSELTETGLNVTGRHKTLSELSVELEDDVTLIVTRAYGPKGDNLVGISDVVFDGYPAVTLLVQAGDREGLVHLSPIHGDDRKSGFTDIPSGTKCRLLCPISKEPLKSIGPIDVADGDTSSIATADYFALYLTSKMDAGSMCMISDIWGHYHSRIIDDFELLSDWEGN